MAIAYRCSVLVHRRRCETIVKLLKSIDLRTETPPVFGGLRIILMSDTSLETYEKHRFKLAMSVWALST